ncbi:hypothetical protein LCGC14_0849220 [marine sediment metagenome]|uniref:Uncharacterized protein n=1 Tax=marine sediment metagenome TaxID=412755 RepID=A0A0F9PFK8_9ZZZZ
MLFDKSFIIWELSDKKISLEEALKIAKREFISDMVYDPRGFGDEKSWWWCAAVLDVLQQDDWIREFKIIKEAPKDQQIESKKGVIY